MNPKSRRILFYLCFIIGLGLALSMNGALSRRAKYENFYREKAAPIVDAHLATQHDSSETKLTNASLEPVSYHEASMIKFIESNLDSMMSSNLARYLMIVGFLIIMIGCKYLDRCKTDKTTKLAEQDAALDRE